MKKAAKLTLTAVILTMFLGAAPRKAAALDTTTVVIATANAIDWFFTIDSPEPDSGSGSSQRQPPPPPPAPSPK